MTVKNANLPRGITLIEALNFRCLRFIRQRLQAFHLLVGPNASGKSTFLDAVNFLSDLVRSDLDTAVRGEPRLGIPFRASDPQQMVWMRRENFFEIAVELAIPDHLRSGENASHDVVRYEMQIQVQDNPRIQAENVWLKPGSEEAARSGARQRLIFPQESLPPENIVHQPKKKSPKGWKKVVTRSETGQSYFISEKTGWNAPFALSPHKPALVNLPEDRERFPVALWLRDTLSQGVQSLVLSAEAMRQPSPPTLQEGYLADGSNLPYVIARLEQKNQQLYQRWIAHIKEALPDIENVTTAERPEDRHRYLIIRYRSGLAAPSWLVSDGTLRTLALTLLAYTGEAKGKVYLVEEPENGIHPKAIQIVFQSLSSVYDSQVLLATHSPLILGMARPDQILCFAQDRAGATDIVSGNEHPSLRNWQGTLDLGTLFAAGVLG